MELGMEMYFRFSGNGTNSFPIDLNTKFRKIRHKSISPSNS